MLIGFSGYARVGKDESANHLVTTHGFKKISFVNPIHACLMILDPVVYIPWHDIMPRPYRYSEIIKKHGYDEAKDKFPEVRQLQQRLGTDVGREYLSEDIWVNKLLDSIVPNTDYAISSVRWPNEADAIKRAGGIMVRIDRPGYGPINDHPSETALDDYDGFDFHIYNEKTLAHLAAAINFILLNQ